MGWSIKKPLGSSKSLGNKFLKTTGVPQTSKWLQKRTGLTPLEQGLIGGAGFYALSGGFGAGAGAASAKGVGAAGASGGFWSTPGGAAIIGGGMGLIGSGISAIGQRQANEAGLQSAREQMEFQERMSSTAHQREVKDLQLAGLNPVLSANSGASSPSGAMFEPENEMPDIGPAISTAMAAMKLKQDLAIGNQQVGLLSAQKDLTIANAKEAGEKAAMLAAQRTMQELENDLYIKNGALMLTEHATKVITALSAEARGWLYGLIAAKFGLKLGKGKESVIIDQKGKPLNYK